MIESQWIGQAQSALDEAVLAASGHPINTEILLHHLFGYLF